MAYSNVAPQTSSLIGRIGSVKFEKDNFKICDLTLLDNYSETYPRGSKITVKGYNIPVTGNFKFIGYFENNPKYPNTFNVIFSEIEPDYLDVLEFLASGLIRGVGKETAKKIYKVFGDKSLEIIENNPEELKRVPSIGDKKKKKIVESYRNVVMAKSFWSYFSSRNITVSEGRIDRLYKRYEGDITKLQANPYDLLNMGFTFQEADRLGLEVFPQDSPERFHAGSLYVLKRHESSGDTVMETEKYRSEVYKILGLRMPPPEQKDANFNSSQHKLSKERGVKFYRKAGLTYVASGDTYFMEDEIAMNIMERNKGLKDTDFYPHIEAIERKSTIMYATAQKKAINMALNARFGVITGGPGTGKSTIIKAILDIFFKINPTANAVLLAPTGRAASRMKEATERSASTIHSYLSMYPDEKVDVVSGEEVATYDPDLVIVDETSMMDVYVSWMLLKSLSMKTKIILIGDYNQLPSVACGNVLRDIIESGVVPTVLLDRVQRQGEDSTININANLILNGRSNIKLDQNFVFIRTRSEEETQKVILQEYFKNKEIYGLDQTEILSPLRQKGDVCTVTLNGLIQKEIFKDQPVSRFNVGDKVMITRNGDGLSNGEVGIIASITRSDGEVIYNIDFGAGIVSLDSKELERLVLAYAITIHKSQGSEYQCVVIACTKGCSILLNKNLLYTAVTRAKQKVVIVGQEEAFYEALSKTGSMRNTNLKWNLLRESVKMN